MEVVSGYGAWTTYSQAGCHLVLRTRRLAVGMVNTVTSLEATYALFIWACLAYKPWLKVLWADLV